MILNPNTNIFVVILCGTLLSTNSLGHLSAIVEYVATPSTSREKESGLMLNTPA